MAYELGNKERVILISNNTGNILGIIDTEKSYEVGEDIEIANLKLFGSTPYDKIKFYIHKLDNEVSNDILKRYVAKFGITSVDKIAIPPTKVMYISERIRL